MFFVCGLTVDNMWITYKNVPMSHILAIDQGTSSSRTIIFNTQLDKIDTLQQEYPLSYPRSGWVEIDPELLVASVTNTLDPLLEKYKESISAIGITNQRESTVVWERSSNKPIYPIIVWQDRRTESLCTEIKEQGKEEIIFQKTGLQVDPYFSATKIAWILDNVTNARKKAEKGDLLFGTVDTYLLWLLTGEHATDVTNASRTMLYNIKKQEWDSDLLDLFNVPQGMLPVVRESDCEFGELKGKKIKVTGMIGDQQAALFGQRCFEENSMKATFGTGCFLMANTGAQPTFSRKGLLTTIGYGISGSTAYALEGSIFSCGTIIQWLRDGLGLFEKAKETEALLNKDWNSNGVIFIPALSGLGVPHWNPSIKASFYGITADNNKKDLITAAFKSIAYQLKEILTLLKQDGLSVQTLSIDGGMTVNKVFCQMLSDLLQEEIIVSRNPETTALGAASVAMLGANITSDLNDLSNISTAGTIFNPKAPFDEEDYQQWRRNLNLLVKEY